MNDLRQHLPSLTGLAREFTSLPASFVTLALGLGALSAQSPRGDGHTVLVLPGFTAPDATTIPLRRFLESLGYRTAGWDLGVNLGIKPAGEEKLEESIRRLAADGPITIIGWSLGGVYAREAARRQPALVRRVVTLGTPIRNRDGAGWIVNVFKVLNPTAADDLTPEGMARHARPIDVPMTAVYSLRDGILDGRACRVPEEDVNLDAQNVRVSATHLGMGFSLEVLAVLAEVLAADSQAETAVAS